MNWFECVRWVWDHDTPSSDRFSITKAGMAVFFQVIEQFNAIISHGKKIEISYNSNFPGAAKPIFDIMCKASKLYFKERKIAPNISATIPYTFMISNKLEKSGSEDAEITLEGLNAMKQLGNVIFPDASHQ